MWRNDSLYFLYIFLQLGHCSSQQPSFLLTTYSNAVITSHVKWGGTEIMTKVSQTVNLSLL